ncbi:hypothetical protein D3C77_364260 [compost metagenome]
MQRYSAAAVIHCANNMYVGRYFKITSDYQKIPVRIVDRIVSQVVVGKDAVIIEH